MINLYLNYLIEGRNLVEKIIYTYIKKQGGVNINH